jgi:hypothetical protein
MDARKPLQNTPSLNAHAADPILLGNEFQMPGFVGVDSQALQTPEACFMQNRPVISPNYTPAQVHNELLSNVWQGYVPALGTNMLRNFGINEEAINYPDYLAQTQSLSISPLRTANDTAASRGRFRTRSPLSPQDNQGRGFSQRDRSRSPRRI